VTRFRFDDATREMVRASRWWELPPEQLREHLPLFQRAQPDPGPLHDALRALTR